MLLLLITHKCLWFKIQRASHATCLCLFDLEVMCFAAFYNVMDVFPFKSALHNLVASFIALTKKVEPHYSIVAHLTMVLFQLT